jgi:hypothetical protein
MWQKILQWLLQTFIVQYIDDVIYYIAKYFEDKNKKAAEEAAKKKLDDVIKKPDATVEEKAKAYEDYLNKN